MSNQTEEKQVFLRTLIIHISFLFTVIMYIFIANFLNLFQRQQTENVEFIFYVLLAISIAEIISLPFIKLIINNSMSQNKDKLQAIFISHIVVCALAEVPAIFAFLLAFLGGGTLYFYTLVAISIFGFIVYFPKQSNFVDSKNSIEPN